MEDIRSFVLPTFCAVAHPERASVSDAARFRGSGVPGPWRARDTMARVVVERRWSYRACRVLWRHVCRQKECICVARRCDGCGQRIRTGSKLQLRSLQVRRFVQRPPGGADRMVWNGLHGPSPRVRAARRSVRAGGIDDTEGSWQPPQGGRREAAQPEEPLLQAGLQVLQAGLAAAAHNEPVLLARGTRRQAHCPAAVCTASAC